MTAFLRDCIQTKREDIEVYKIDTDVVDPRFLLQLYETLLVAEMALHDARLQLGLANYKQTNCGPAMRVCEGALLCIRSLGK